MPESKEHPVDRAGKRGIAAILGLVLGLAAGLIVALFTVGFGELFIPVLAGVALSTAILGWTVPTPFLCVGALLLGVFSEVG